MATPCPNCGRKNTVCLLYGEGCYGCTPPDFDEYELDAVDVGGRLYMIPKNQKYQLQFVLDNLRYDKRSNTFEVVTDTGRCGLQTLHRFDTSAEEVLRVRCQAIPAKAVVEIEEYNRLLQLKRQRCVEDQVK